MDTTRDPRLLRYDRYPSRVLHRPHRGRWWRLNSSLRRIHNAEETHFSVESKPRT
jgi:hypothetical protein